MPKKVTKLERLDRSQSSLTNLLIRLAMNVFALWIVDYLLEGVVLTDFRATVIAAVVIGLINTYIRPIFQFIALPLSILTLGIGAFLVNVLMIWIASLIVPGFYIDSFLTAAIASILLTLISWFLHKLSRG